METAAKAGLPILLLPHRDAGANPSDPSARPMPLALHGIVTPDDWRSLPDAAQREALVWAYQLTEARAIRFDATRLAGRLNNLHTFAQDCRRVVEEGRADEFCETTYDAVESLVEGNTFRRLLDPIVSEAERHIRDIVAQHLLTPAASA